MIVRFQNCNLIDLNVTQFSNAVETALNKRDEQSNNNKPER